MATKKVVTMWTKITMTTETEAIKMKEMKTN